MKNIKKYKILVVDDDDRILRLIKNTLERSGYKVVTKADLKDIELSSFIGYDLILLDIMMPINGLEICRRIRKQIKVPIIFVTAKQLDSDLLAGINAGADDYIKKPFSIKELEARVQMHLRREERSQFHQIQHGDLLLDIDQQVLFVKNQPLSLTKREFTLVHILASQPRKIFTVEELFERLYPAESDTQFRSIAEYIYQIRSKLKVYSINPIRTQWGGRLSMERKLNFQGHIEKTVWRIIWQFGLSIILAYLVPLVFLSIEIHSNSYSFNREVLNIFFNVFSWMYACTMLVIIISINLTKLLKIVKQDMDIVYHQSLWLNHNPRSWDIQIAEFSQTNRHIEAMQERIERMVQAEKKQKKDVLFKVSAMAHDLKTPLTVIQGNAELLQFSIQSNQNYQCLKDIEKASQQLDDYFNQLISYAKMSYTKPIYFSDYSVENLAKVIKDECAYLIGKTITYHLSEDLKEGYTVHVDMDLIIRSVDNIINNAISYGSKPNQEIRLYIVADARHLRIIIWNRGAGFSEEVLENFGSLFYKADSSRSHKNQHFGIGLAFVKQVMVLHAGYIQLQNINQGARVELAIPVYEKG